MKRYAVIIEEGPTSFGASVPDLPDVFAVARTRDEVLKLIEEAIEFHIEGLALDGETVPDPVSTVAYVQVKPITAA